MKFEGFGSKGTRVIERKRSVTDGQTARRTRQKQYVSPQRSCSHQDRSACGIQKLCDKQFLRAKTMFTFFS